MAMASSALFLYFVGLFGLGLCRNFGSYVKNKDEANCGYSSCNPVKDGFINVHVVPHTHDDVGWLQTVDQYFYNEVQFILDSVIPELVNDPQKRFIYVEIAFFARWYREQNDIMRHTVNKLVQNGQLEFILGGWCMNDEAATHYNDIIDQHTLGFEFLRENFGPCGKPRVGWQIDPFGHSREQASLFARFGFDSLFFGRLDYQDKDNRQNQTTMEMIWRGSPDNLGEAADLFTGVLQDGYGPPPGGFCFDIFCGDTPIVDDTRLHDVNVQDKVDAFLAAMATQAKHYTTNHLMVTMGSDFNYQAAHNWFKNLDKLIYYVNARQASGSKVNLLYSTPSCYTWHVNKAGRTYTTKEDDFFPYAHRPHSFWTGYFTSRAALKGYVRQVNNFLQVVKQLDALAILEDTDNSTFNLNILAEALGVAQHHDGVSGTSKQAVAYDYAERLANGVMEGQKVVNDAIKKLQQQSALPVMEQNFCTLLNISVCSVTETANQFYVTVYNPVGRPGQSYVRIPVSSTATDGFTVTDPNGQRVTSEMIPITPDTFRIPERNQDASKYELVFPVNLVPLGFAIYTVNRIQAAKYSALERHAFLAGQDIVLKNEFISLAFDGSTGLVKNMSNLQSQLSVNLQQGFSYYTGHDGNNSQPQFQASGAYIFRPNSTSGHGLKLSSAKLKAKSYYLQGQLVQEVYQEFLPWLTQTVKLYSGKPYAEFQWTVGPIPINDRLGKEVISVFQTNLVNKGTFYTDANGREVLKRQLNHRDTWSFNNSEPVAGNYYPVNSRIYIRDEAKQAQFMVLTDRSQGGSSLGDGEIELMVHRRLLYDDALGVGEPLNETGSDGSGLIVRGSHYVMLEPVSSAAKAHRDLAERLFLAPSISFSLASVQPRAGASLTWSGVRQALPDNIHLLTLEQFRAFGPAPSTSQPFLLRLEHFYESGEDPVLSQPVTLDLQTLFSPFDITEVVELTLGGDMVLSDLHRLQWNYPHANENKFSSLQKDNTLRFHPESQQMDSKMAFPVTLHPMEIRTFQIALQPLSH